LKETELREMELELREMELKEVFLGHVCTLGDCISSVLYRLVSLLLLIYFPVAPWPVVPSFPAHPLTLAVVVHHCYFLLGCLLRWVPSILIYTYLYLSIPIYTSIPYIANSQLSTVISTACPTLSLELKSTRHREG
jgi:hypothetical protein